MRSAWRIAHLFDTAVVERHIRMALHAMCDVPVRLWERKRSEEGRRATMGDVSLVLMDGKERKKAERREREE